MKQNEKPLEQVIKELTEKRDKLFTEANGHKEKIEHVYNEIHLIDATLKNLDLIYPQPFQKNILATMNKTTHRWQVSPLYEGKEDGSQIIKWRKLVTKFLQENSGKKFSSTDIFEAIVTWNPPDKEKANQVISLSNSLRKMRQNETVKYMQLPNKEYRYYL